MLIASLIAIALMIILGIIFSTGKGAFLIAGYNTMKKDEKEKYDTIALCKFMGKCMFALAISISLWSLSDLLDKSWLFIVGLVLFFIVIGFTLIYTNTNNRFKK